MVHLQRAVEVSRFGNWKNSGISPTTILPLLLLYIANFTISKKKEGIVYFFFQPRALFQISFVFERYLLVLLLTRAITARYLALSHAHHALLPHNHHAQ